MARTRTKFSPRPAGGSYQRYIGGSLVASGTQGTTGTLINEVCVDEATTPNVPHGLSIEKQENGVGPLNGVNPNGPRYYNNWYPTGTAAVPGHLPDATYPTDNVALATAAAARTNPGNPSVSPYVFAAELRELPDLVRHRGNDLIKLFSRGYLSFQFGWQPFVSDVAKLLDFEAATTRKVGELQRLYSKGGLRRRVSLNHSTVSSVNPSLVIDSVMTTQIICRVDTTTSRESWATVRWKPSTLPDFKDEAGLRRMARKVVFGINSGPQFVDAWNIIPWTWLIDWFSTTGDYLAAHGNRVPCTVPVCCVMHKISTQASYTRIDSAPYSGGNGVMRRVSKNRHIGSIGLKSSIPFLSGRQLSILGALAVSKA